MGIDTETSASQDGAAAAKEGRLLNIVKASESTTYTHSKIQTDRRLRYGERIIFWFSRWRSGGSNSGIVVGS